MLVVVLILSGNVFSKSNPNEMLWVAAQTGNLEAVKGSIAIGADVNSSDQEGDTALHFAAKYPAVAAYLIQKGANVDARNNWGDTPIFRVANNGNLKMVQFFADKGAELDLRNDHGATPLNYASGNGHIAVMQYLIDHGANVNTLGNGHSPLAWACHNSHHGYLEAVKLLLEKEADINQSFRYEGKYADNPDNQWLRGWTPLMFAIHDWGATTDIIQYLLDHGANPKAVSENGETPLYVDFIVGNRLGNQMEIAKLLLAKGVDINGWVRDFGSVLHYAAMMGSSQAIKDLLALGANINLPCNGGQTPLLTAIKSNEHSLETVRLLVENGADVNRGDDSGWTPLHEACSKGDLELVKYLISKGADKSLQNKDGATPFAVISQEHQDLIDYLKDWATIDWNQIKPLAVDKVGDALDGATDLEAGYAVMDEGYLYLAAKTNSVDPMVDISIQCNGDQGNQFLVLFLSNLNRADIFRIDQGKAVPIGSASLSYNPLETVIPLKMLGDPKSVTVNFAVKRIKGNDDYRTYDEIPGWYEVKGNKQR